MVSAIIVAAGSGRRMGVKKQFMDICGRPLISYTLEVFEGSAVDEIVLVTAKEDIEKMREIAKEFNITKLKAVVIGGKERPDSVQNGIDASSGDILLIHDGARPFVKPSEIESVIKGVELHGCAALGYPVKDTIKVIDHGGFVTETPMRETLYAAATPQGFLRDIITKAYKTSNDDGLAVTDDAMVAEHAGFRVKMLPCSYENIKITTIEDIPLAERIIQNENRQRI